MSAIDYDRACGIDSLAHRVTGARLAPVPAHADAPRPADRARPPPGIRTVRRRLRRAVDALRETWKPLAGPRSGRPVALVDQPAGPPRRADGAAWPSRPAALRR